MSKEVKEPAVRMIKRDTISTAKYRIYLLQEIVFDVKLL